MDIFTLILIIVGLSLFEIINSADNAVINAEVLSTMQKKSRRWFLIVGIFFAVFVVRGLLPWLILWLSSPSIGPWDAFMSIFRNDPAAINSIKDTSHVLLAGAGTFLFLLFLRWIFIESKAENQKITNIGRSLFHLASFLFVGAVLYFSMKISDTAAFSVLMGALVFYIIVEIRKRTEIHGKSVSKKLSDSGKVAYLEIVDAIFSIEGIAGAFAFTFSIPLIIIGNGVGAIVVRQLTVRNINRVSRLKSLKGHAMYSILLVALIMLLDSFGFEIHPLVAPIAIFCVVGYSFLLSKKEIK